MAVNSNLLLLLYTKKKPRRSADWAQAGPYRRKAPSSRRNRAYPAGFQRGVTGAPAGHGRRSCGHGPVGEVLPTQKFQTGGVSRSQAGPDGAGLHPARQGR